MGTRRCRTKWIYVERDPLAIGVNRPIDAPLVGDLRDILPQLTQAVGAACRPPRLAGWIAAQTRHRSDLAAAPAGRKPVHTANLVVEATRAFPDDGIMVRDGGATHRSSPGPIRRRHPATSCGTRTSATSEPACPMRSVRSLQSATQGHADDRRQLVPVPHFRARDRRRKNLPIIVVVSCDYAWGLEVGVYRRAMGPQSPETEAHLEQAACASTNWPKHFGALRRICRAATIRSARRSARAGQRQARVIHVPVDPDVERDRGAELCGIRVLGKLLSKAARGREPAMAKGIVLDPTAARDDDMPAPAPTPACSPASAIGFRLDQSGALGLDQRRWAEKFRARRCEVSFWRSGGRSGEEGERMARELEDWLKTIDVAVVGLANCGSCTGWTIRDAITRRQLRPADRRRRDQEFRGLRARDRRARRALGPARACPALSAQRTAQRRSRCASASSISAGMLDTMGAPDGEGARGMSIVPSSRPAADASALRRSHWSVAIAALQGCEVDWLASQPHETDLDIEAFTDFALAQGLGRRPAADPADRARASAASCAERPLSRRSDRASAADAVECTVEKIVINAVMAGAPPESLELLIAAVDVDRRPRFRALRRQRHHRAGLSGLRRQRPGPATSSTFPISYGCFGGVATKAAAIGRAIRLIMRNVAGQVAGR